jgi:hypothetical protein
MAWEWLAPASALVGASVGVLGTWLTGRGSRRHAETIAKLGLDHAAQMAREERRQQRFADAYVEMLMTVERMGHWAQLVCPWYNTGSPVPPLPELDEQARVEAVVKAYASAGIRELFEQYLETVSAIARMECQINFLLEHGERAGGPDSAELWQQLDDTLRPGELAARRALAAQVSVELGQPT